MRCLTPRIALELLAHEGLVSEAYRDSQGVWTWSVGITNASGHRVHPRYHDKPQPLAHCLGVYLWLLRTRYLPAVLAAFGDYDPAEHELGAALSFHYNTGAITRADWFRRFLAGDRDGARAAFLNWSRPVEIVPRRRRERDLMFDGTWSGDGTVMLYEVAKPRYVPVRGRKVAIGDLVARLLVAEGSPTPLPASPAPAPSVPLAAACPAPVPVIPSPPPQASPPPAPDPQPPALSWFDRLFG